MAMSNEISHNLELTKNHLLNSELSDEDKNIGINILNIAAIATNGITLEEKIQKMSESVFSLISWQMRLMSQIDKQIDERVKIQTKDNCNNCIAYKHAMEAEKEKKQQEIIDAYLKSAGLAPRKRQKEESHEQTPSTFTDTLKAILLKPYPYIFLSVATFSPYIVDIIKLIIAKF